MGKGVRSLLSGEFAHYLASTSPNIPSLSARASAVASSESVESPARQKDPLEEHTFFITENNGERFEKSIGKLPRVGTNLVLGSKLSLYPISQQSRQESGKMVSAGRTNGKISCFRPK